MASFSQKRYLDIISNFKKMKEFKNTDDIPDIPIVSTEDYNNAIIPNLIRCGAIPKEKLIVGKTYTGSCRNSEDAVWNGKEFEYQRYKFGATYTEKIKHFQDDDGYDVFVPLKEKQNN